MKKGFELQRAVSVEDSAGAWVRCLCCGETFEADPNSGVGLYYCGKEGRVRLLCPQCGQRECRHR